MIGQEIAGVGWPTSGDRASAIVNFLSKLPSPALKKYLDEETEFPKAQLVLIHAGL
jgi:hypothetical protein